MVVRPGCVPDSGRTVGSRALDIRILDQFGTVSHPRVIYELLRYRPDEEGRCLRNDTTTLDTPDSRPRPLGSGTTDRHRGHDPSVCLHELVTRNVCPSGSGTGVPRVIESPLRTCLSPPVLSVYNGGSTPVRRTGVK